MAENRPTIDELAASYLREQEEPLVDRRQRLLLNAFQYQDDQIRERDYQRSLPKLNFDRETANQAGTEGFFLPDTVGTTAKPFPTRRPIRADAPTGNPALAPDASMVPTKLRDDQLPPTPNTLDDRPLAKFGKFESAAVARFTPPMIKLAWENSLTGKVFTWVNGESMFDMTDYEPNVVEDIAAMALGFALPLDNAAIKAGSMVAKIGIGKISSRLVNKLVRSGVMPEVAERAVRRATQHWMSRAGQGAASTGAGLGTYGAAESIARQKAQGAEDIDWRTVGHDAVHSTALGIILGTTSGLTKPWGEALRRTEDGGYKYVGRPEGKLAELGAEIGAFAGGGALLEGRMPTTDDLTHATGLVVGLKLQGFSTNWLRQRIAERLWDKVSTGESEDLADAVNDFMADPKELQNLESLEPPESKKARKKAQKNAAEGKPADPIKPENDRTGELKKLEELSQSNPDALRARLADMGHKPESLDPMGSEELLYWASGGRAGRLPVSGETTPTAAPQQVAPVQSTTGQQTQKPESPPKLGETVNLGDQLTTPKSEPEPPAPTPERTSRQKWLEDIRDKYQAAGMAAHVSAKNATELYNVIETGKYSDIVHPDNKNSRRIYEEVTGEKIPNGVAATKDFFREKALRIRQKASSEELGNFKGTIADQFTGELGGEATSGTPGGIPAGLLAGPPPKAGTIGAAIRGDGWYAYVAGSGGKKYYSKEPFKTADEATEFARRLRSEIGLDQVSKRVKEAKQEELDYRNAISGEPTPDQIKQIEKLMQKVRDLEDIEEVEGGPGFKAEEPRTEVVPPRTEIVPPLEAPVEPKPEVSKRTTLTDHFLEGLRNKGTTDLYHPDAVVRSAKEFDPKLDPDKDYDKIADALEMALARFYHERVKNETDFGKRLHLAQMAEDKLPRRRRTLEAGSLEKQQFSTPLTLAEGMYQAAKVGDKDRIFEPTAGTGNLIAPVKDWNNVAVNELHDTRANLMRELFGDKVTQEDYLKHKPSEKYDVILTNPPWGSAGRSKYAAALGLPDLAAAFVNKNLKDLKQGGRLVALLPTTMLPGQSVASAKWFKNLAEMHDIRAVIMSPPKAYGPSRGTDVNSFMLVVDAGKNGVGKEPVLAYDDALQNNKPRLRDIAETDAQLKKLFPSVTREAVADFDAWQKAVAKIGDRPYNQVKEGDLSDATNSKPDVSVPVVPTATPAAAGSVRPSGQGSAPGGDIQLGGSGSTPVARPVRPESTTRPEVVPEESGQGSEVPEVPVIAPGGHASGGKLGSVKLRPVDSNVFVGYVSGYSRGSGPDHPRQITVTKGAIAAGLPDIEHVRLSDAVTQANKAGELSNQQYEFIARGESNLDMGRPFMHGHDVGVGKTRVAAGHALEWLSTGKANRILYISKSEQNIKDAIAEFNTISPGGKFPYRLVHIPAEFKEASALYTAGPQIPIPKLDKTVYLIQSGSFNNYFRGLLELAPDGFIGDESHTFRSAESQRGAKWVKLQKQLKDQKARRVYLSATAARNPEEMEYLYLDWDPGTFGNWADKMQGRTGKPQHKPLTDAQIDAAATGSSKTPIKIGAKGDVRFTPKETEQIIRELHAKGFVFQGDMDRKGVEFRVHEQQLSSDQLRTIDESTALIRDIRAAYKKYVKANKGLKKAFGIEGGIQFLVKDLLFSQRIDAAINEAKESIKRGEQAVISVIRVKGEVPEGEKDPVRDTEADEIDVTYGLPKRLLAVIRDINERVVDKDGTDLGEIPEALVVKQELLERAQAIWPKMSDPVERVRMAFGEGQVAEITGRNTVKNRVLATSEFQSGKRQVAVISGVGKTGISLHDVNGKRRHLIVADYEWTSDTFKQEMGRVDRASQVSAPIITAVHFGLPGERSFIGVLANRMRDLGATAKGSSKSTGTEAMEAFEFGGPLQYLALKEAWREMPYELQEYFAAVSKEFRDSNTNAPISMLTEVDFNVLKKFMRNLQTMPRSEAEEAFGYFEKQLKDVIAENAREELKQLQKIGADTAEMEKLLDQGVPWTEIRKQLHETGDKLREAELDSGLKLTEVKAKDGAHYAIVSGILSDHLPNLKGWVTGSSDHLKYVDFHTPEGTISGLEVLPSRIRGLAERYQAEGFGTKLTIDNLSTALGAGDKVPLRNGWTIHEGRSGNRSGLLVVTGPQMKEVVQESSTGQKTLKFGLAYHNAGFYHIPKEKLTDFVKEIGLGATEVVDPNKAAGTTLNVGLNPGDLFPGRDVTLRRMMERAISNREEELRSLPTVSFGGTTNIKDLGWSRFVLTPSYIFGAIPGMPARFGRAGQAGMQKILLTEVDMRIETGQRQQQLEDLVKSIPARDLGKTGEKFVNVFDGRSIDDILRRTDISEETKGAARRLREFFTKDREEHIKTIRAVYRPGVSRAVRRDMPDADAQARRLEVERRLDEFMPRDWGIDDYFPHVFPGSFRIFRDYGDGVTEWVTTARTKIEALAKISEDYAVMRDAGDRGFTYKVDKRLFADPDVVRISSPRMRKLMADLSEAAEIDQAEVQQAMRGKIGRVEGKRKHFFAFNKREGYLGYSKNLKEVLDLYNRGYVRTKHLTTLNAKVQPLIRRMRNEGRPQAAAFLESIFNELWGYQHESSRYFDAMLQRIPWLGDRVMPFALDRWLGYLKAGTYTGLLRFNPRFHALNRMQTYQTLLPIVSLGTFVDGRKLYRSAEGKELLRKYGVRFLTGGKGVEAGGTFTTPEFREKLRGFAPETFNQEVAWLTMFEAARKAGYGEEAASKYAFLRGNVFSQFAFLNADRPFVGRGPIKSTAFLFKRFPIKNLELGMTLLADKEYPGFARWMGAQFLLGGARSFEWGYGGVLGAFGKGYIPFSLYQKLADEDEMLADFVYFGLPGLVGLDMSHSVNILEVPYGNTLPEKVFNELVGPLGTITYKTFKDAANTKGTVSSTGERAIRSLVNQIPALRFLTAAEVVFNKVDEGGYNFRSATGKLQFEAEFKEVITHAMGGRPVSKGVDDLRFDAATELMTWRDRVLDEAVQLWIENDGYEETEEIVKWNALWGDVWPITPKQVRTRKKAREANADKSTFERAVPNKKLRNWLEVEEDEAQPAP